MILHCESKRCFIPLPTLHNLKHQSVDDKQIARPAEFKYIICNCSLIFFRYRWLKTTQILFLDSFVDLELVINQNFYT